MRGPLPYGCSRLERRGVRLRTARAWPGGMSSRFARRDPSAARTGSTSRRRAELVLPTTLRPQPERWPSRGSAPEIGEDGKHAPVVVGGEEEPELEEDAVDVRLDGLGAEEELRADRLMNADGSSRVAAQAAVTLEFAGPTTWPFVLAILVGIAAVVGGIIIACRKPRPRAPQARGAVAAPKAQTGEGPVSGSTREEYARTARGGRA